jgi:hypothetical protein
MWRAVGTVQAPGVNRGVARVGQEVDRAFLVLAGRRR